MAAAALSPGTRSVWGQIRKKEEGEKAERKAVDTLPPPPGQVLHCRQLSALLLLLPLISFQPSTGSPWFTTTTIGQACRLLASALTFSCLPVSCLSHSLGDSSGDLVMSKAPLLYFFCFFFVVAWTQRRQSANYVSHVCMTVQPVVTYGGSRVL